MPNFLQSPAWRAVRGLALKRDGFRCVKCGVSVRGRGEARVDHIQPRSTHPHLKLTLANLRTLCPRCDNQAHREKKRVVKTGAREERFVITGWRPDGTPIDPNHHWNRK
jgi:5-methylcytosine-specific restriction endonuclease McrA